MGAPVPDFASDQFAPGQHSGNPSASVGLNIVSQYSTGIAQAIMPRLADMPTHSPDVESLCAGTAATGGALSSVRNNM